MADSTEIERFRRAWRDRRTRFFAVLAMLFAFAVLMMASASAVVATVGLAATLAVAWRYVSFHCPRCDDTFPSVPDALGP